MKSIVLGAILAATLATMPVLAQTSAPQTTGAIPAAEGSISLTDEQRVKIKQFLGKQKPAQLDQKATVGSTLPDNFELHAIQDAGTGVPAIALNYRYMMAQNQLLVVDPRTRRVMAIVPE